MGEIVRLLMSNYFLTLFILGLVAAGISLMRAPRPIPRERVVRTLLSYFLLFPTGIGYLLSFIFHVFYSGPAAAFIGWEDSPFQIELGFACLGFAAIAFLGFRGSEGMRAAAVISVACFQLGAAAGHIYQMITQDNFAPGNAGSIFYMDIILPIFGLTLLSMELRHARARLAERNVQGTRIVEARPPAWH